MGGNGGQEWKGMGHLLEGKGPTLWNSINLDFENTVFSRNSPCEIHLKMQSNGIHSTMQFVAFSSSQGETLLTDSHSQPQTSLHVPTCTLSTPRITQLCTGLVWSISSIAYFLGLSPFWAPPA